MMGLDLAKIMQPIETMNIQLISILSEISGKLDTTNDLLRELINKE